MSLRHLLSISLLCGSLGAAPALVAAAPATSVVSAPTWSTLAAAGGFRTDGRRFITVAPAAGTFDTLRISGVTGTTTIRQVVVQFTDGTAQIARRLAAEADGSCPFKLDLPADARVVKRVVVYGVSQTDDGGVGTFTVLGR